MSASLSSDNDADKFSFLIAKLSNVDSNLFWYAPIFDLASETLSIALSIVPMKLEAA